eukprot:ANDGO_06281.mRNA.1 Rabphilin-1
MGKTDNLDFNEDGTNAGVEDSQAKEDAELKVKLAKAEEKDREKILKAEEARKAKEADKAVEESKRSEELRRKTDRRVFKCVIRTVQLRKIAEKCDPYVKFKLGGISTKKETKHLDKTEEENREAFLAVKKPMKKFKTKKFKNARRGSSVTYNQVFVKYWYGTYDDLEKEFLRVELWDWDMFTRNDYMGEGRIKLSDLANGNVQQHMNMLPSLQRSKGKRRVVAGEVDFQCYFQEVFDFKLNFYDWEGKNLIAADFGGTSDPYIVFSIPRSWSNPFTRGVAWGRSCKSPVVSNTLFPRWEDCGNLHYRGTRSELEDEDLTLKVYDWDLSSADDFIGAAVLPLRGILEYGFLQCGLLIKGKVKVPNQGKKKEWNLPAGSLSGYVRAEDLPMHQQFGEQVTLRDHHRYLAVHISQCTQLRDIHMGYSDPFVAVEWDGMKQETRVIEKELNPYFDEVLYFPVRMSNVGDVEELRKKPRIRLSVYHHGSAGNDFLGTTELPLYAILLSKVEKTREFDGQKTRMFRGTMKLANLGSMTDSTISFKAYFVRDFPPEMVLEEDESMQFKGEVVDRDLPLIYREREEKWRNSMFRAGIRITDGEFPCKALDEQRVYRFLPTFLTPMVPPRDLRNVLALARMVQCITWAEDDDIYAAALARTTAGMRAAMQQQPVVPGTVKASKKAVQQIAQTPVSASSQSVDIWTTPTFFLSVRKGDSEDHAILMVNLLLGMGKDAYLCYGKSRSGVDKYVWVLVREGDGSVHMWETTTARMYRLGDRWIGQGLTQEEAEACEFGLEDVVHYDKKTKDAIRKYRRRLKSVIKKMETAKKKSLKKNNGVEADVSAASVKDVADEADAKVEDDKRLKELEEIAERGDAAVEEFPDVDRDAQAASNMGLEADVDQPEFEMDDEPQNPEIAAKAAEEDVKDEQKRQIEAKLKRRKYEEEEVKKKERKLQKDLKSISKEVWTKDLEIFDDDAMLDAKDIFADIRAPEYQTLFQTVMTLDGHIPLPNSVMAGHDENRGILTPAYVPYGSIEVICNHENLWANISGELDPSKVRFDVEDESVWLPFVSEDSRIPPPIPFYDPKPLGPKMAKARAAALSTLIYNEVKSGYMVWRHRANMETKFLNEFSSLLADGLRVLEATRTTPPSVVQLVRRKTKEIGELLINTEDEEARDLIAVHLKALRSEADKYDFEYWRGKLMQRLPGGYEFEGVPISFSYTDHKRIRRYIMEHFDYHEDSDEKINFLLAVHVTPYANSVSSVWVFIAKMWETVTTADKTEDAQNGAAAKTSKAADNRAASAAPAGASSVPAAAGATAGPKKTGSQKTVKEGAGTGLSDS